MPDLTWRNLFFHSILVHLNKMYRICTLVLYCTTRMFSSFMENALTFALLPQRTEAFLVCWHRPLLLPTTLYLLSSTLLSLPHEFMVVLINQVISLTHNIPMIYPYWVTQTVGDTSWCYWQLWLVQGGLKNQSLLFLRCCRWVVVSV